MAAANGWNVEWIASRVERRRDTATDSVRAKLLPVADALFFRSFPQNAALRRTNTHTLAVIRHTLSSDGHLIPAAITASLTGSPLTVFFFFSSFTLFPFLRQIPTFFAPSSRYTGRRQQSTACESLGLTQGKKAGKERDPDFEPQFLFLREL